MKKKKFIGSQYPLRKTPRGILAPSNGVDQIKADLLQLLLTNPGERVMMPEFGTPLRKLQFELNDPRLIIEAKQMIADSISKWEPRIEINGIEVYNGYGSEEESESVLSIQILFFDPEKIDEVESLKLELPIGDK